MPFSLYRRPGGVTFLDDDVDFLQMLATTMPETWAVRLFSDPPTCIAALMDEQERWDEDDRSQQQILRRFSQGGDLVPDILKYWCSDGWERFKLTKVAVFDYAMPRMSGLQALGELTQWHGSRILLTGHVDEQLAVSAFNRGLIQQFIRKQSGNHRKELAAAIQNLLFQPHSGQQHTWRITLSKQQLDLLERPDVSMALSDIQCRHGFLEHVVVGVPFGLLGLDKMGKATWVKLVQESELKHLAEIAQYDGQNELVVRAAATGEIVIERDLYASLGLGFVPVSSEPIRIGSRENAVHAALFAIPDAFSPGLDASYHQFLARIGERAVEPHN